MCDIFSVGAKLFDMKLLHRMVIITDTVIASIITDSGWTMVKMLVRYFVLRHI